VTSPISLTGRYAVITSTKSCRLRAPLRALKSCLMDPAHPHTRTHTHTHTRTHTNTHDAHTHDARTHQLHRLTLSNAQVFDGTAATSPCVRRGDGEATYMYVGNIPCIPEAMVCVCASSFIVRLCARRCSVCVCYVLCAVCCVCAGVCVCACVYVCVCMRVCVCVCMCAVACILVCETVLQACRVGATGL
jgi:hypothetical protein